MYQDIHANIYRQKQALSLLIELQGEEFSYLTSGEPQAVTGCEFSIQELLRQIAAERIALKALIECACPGAENMHGYMATLPAKEKTQAAQIMKQILDLEQECSVQAEKNAHLAFALAKQHHDMLDYMHKKIQPQKTVVYGANARYTQTATQGSVVHGRL